MSKTSHDSSTTAADPNMGYEHSDTPGRAIYIGLGISVVAVIIITVLLNEFFVMTREEVKMNQVASVVSPTLTEVESRTQYNISTYEWVDSTAGVVRIPIDRAMELMVEEAYKERLQGGR